MRSWGGGGLDGGRGEAIPRGNGPIRKSDRGREDNRGRGGDSRKGDGDRSRETSTGLSRFREGAFREERERKMGVKGRWESVGTDGMVVRGLQGWLGLGKGEENAEDGREERREWNRRSMGRFSATVEGEDLARNGGVGRAGGGRR